MVLNEMICPRCGHVAYTECSYLVCASCECMFYAAHSARRPFPNTAGGNYLPSLYLKHFDVNACAAQPTGYWFMLTGHP